MKRRIRRINGDLLCVRTHAERVPGLAWVMDAVSGIAIGVEQRLILICVAGRHHDQARIFPLAKNIGGQAIECSRPRGGASSVTSIRTRNGHAEYPIHVWSCDFRQGNCRHSEGAIGLFLVARSGRQKLHRLNPMLDRDGALRRQRINEITVKGKTGQTGTVAYVVLDSPRWINAVQIVEANVWGQKWVPWVHTGVEEADADTVIATCGGSREQLIDPLALLYWGSASKNSAVSFALRISATSLRSRID